MQSDNFLVIQGWMRTELNLKGNDLLVFAVIYGFSQTEGQQFTGNLQYLADWCGATKQGIQKNLKNLIELQLIEKKELIINNVRVCRYEPKVHRYEPKVHGGMNLRFTNNILDNKKDNKKPISKEIGPEVEPSFKISSKKPLVKKPNLFTKCAQEIESRDYGEELKLVLMDYLMLRLEMKDKPLFFNSWKGLLNKLERDFQSNDRINVVLQSIERGYASFFPIGGDGKSFKFKESGSNHVKAMTKEDKEKENEFHERCRQKGLPTHF